MRLSKSFESLFSAVQDNNFLSFVLLQTKELKLANVVALNHVVLLM